MNGVVTRTTRQTVGVEVTDQQIIARSTRLNQRISEITAVDDKTFARVVAIALVGWHAGYDVHKPIAVEVPGRCRETKLVLRQAAGDDQTILAQVVRTYEAVPLSPVLAVNHKHRTTVGVGGVAGGVIANHGVLPTRQQQQVVVTILVEVAKLRGSHQLVHGSTVEGNHTTLSTQGFQGGQRWPISCRAKHQMEDSFAHRRTCGHTGHIVGRTKDVVHDAVAINVARRLNLQACQGTLVGGVGAVVVG